MKDHLGEGLEFADSDINNGREKTHSEITVLLHDLGNFSWSLTKKKNDRLIDGRKIISRIYDLVNKLHKNYNNNTIGYLPIAIHYPTQRTVVIGNKLTLSARCQG